MLIGRKIVPKGQGQQFVGRNGGRNPAVCDIASEALQSRSDIGAAGKPFSESVLDQGVQPADLLGGAPTRATSRGLRLAPV